MKIVLCGDSWGIGVYRQVHDGLIATGEGIQSILQNLGHTVTNISKGGASNWLMVDRLSNRWGNFSRCKYGVDPSEKIEIIWSDIDAIVFLHTDIFREQYLYEETLTGWQKKLDVEFSKSLLSYNSIQEFIDQYFFKLYTELNSIAAAKNKNVYMLGCWSQLHPTVSNFSNLVPVAYSATKLILPILENDVYFSDPEWYIQLSADKEFMNKFGNEWKEMTIQANTKLNIIYSSWHEVHPNINGYKILTDQILDVLAKNNS